MTQPPSSRGGGRSLPAGAGGREEGAEPGPGRCVAQVRKRKLEEGERGTGRGRKADRKRAREGRGRGGEGGGERPGRGAEAEGAGRVNDRCRHFRRRPRRLRLFGAVGGGLGDVAAPLADSGWELSWVAGRTGFVPRAARGNGAETLEGAEF